MLCFNIPVLVSGFALLIIYTLIKFYVLKPTKLPEPEKENVRISPIYSPVNDESDSSHEEDKKTQWSSYGLVLIMLFEKIMLPVLC